jgi:hypothetical protein
MAMNAFVREILNGVAEILPVAAHRERDPGGYLPVDAPNFPNDLDPVIRAEPDGTDLPDDERQEAADGT